MKINKRFVSLTILVLGSILFITLFLSCGGPYSPDTSYYVNPTLKNHLDYIDELQTESEWFRDQGNNKWSGWMNIFLAIETVLGATVTTVVATSIWGEHKKSKAIISFVLAILLIITSGAVFLIKAENERFYNEHRDQYIPLSQKINAIITEFTIDFESMGINNENFESYRQEFLDLATDTYRAINDLKMEYFEQYGLEINYPY